MADRCAEAARRGLVCQHGMLVHPPSAHDRRVGESRRLHEPCPIHYPEECPGCGSRKRDRAAGLTPGSLRPDAKPWQQGWCGHVWHGEFRSPIRQVPRVVNTPEKAERYGRSLMRDARFLERAVGELPDYLEVLPHRDEVVHRLRDLRERIDRFLEGRR